MKKNLFKAMTFCLPQTRLRITQASLALPSLLPRFSGQLSVVGSRKTIVKDQGSKFPALGFCVLALVMGLAMSQSVWAQDATTEIAKAVEMLDSDPEGAVAVLEKYAKEGNADAQYELGHCYEFGYGVEEDCVEAAIYFLKAARQGKVEAQFRVAYCYESGDGVMKNHAEALKWFRKAAEQGYADAQHVLGACYKTGDGVKKDDKEAVKWFRMAAEQGSADAQFVLGCCYNNGEGVSIDFDEAEKWFKKAADQGLEEAQQALKSVDKNKGHRKLKLLWWVVVLCIVAFFPAYKFTKKKEEGSK